MAAASFRTRVGGLRSRRQRERKFRYRGIMPHDQERPCGRGRTADQVQKLHRRRLVYAAVEADRRGCSEPGLRKLPRLTSPASGGAHDLVRQVADRAQPVVSEDDEDVAGAQDQPHLEYVSDVVEVVETYVYQPGLRPFVALVSAAKRLQSGRLDAYLLYMLIVLIAIIAVVTALA